MQTTFYRLVFAENPRAKNRIVILALQHAHNIMNIPDNPEDMNLVKLKAKATDFINAPMGYADRLMLSVAALLPKSQLHDGVDDSDLLASITDIFDALAGVTPPQSS